MPRAPKRQSEDTRSRWFVFTKKGPTDDTFPDEERYHQLIAEGEFLYICWAEEHGTIKGNCHHQGWAYTKHKKAYTAVARLLRCNHAENMYGTPLDSDDYCSKEGVLKHAGKRPSQGKRTDLEEYADEIKSGLSVNEILMRDPQAFHQYGRTLQALEDACLEGLSRSSPTIGLWFWGPTGSGKSRTAFHSYTTKSHYVYNVEDKGWWEAYEGQSTVILDDFRGQISYSQLLRLTDRYAMTVPRRGRRPVPFVSKRLIVTSALPPAQVFHNLAEHDSLEQLYRRFKVFEFPVNDVEKMVIESLLS